LNNDNQDDLVARAGQYCRSILETAEPSGLPEHVIHEMNSIVERADRELG
jgi:trimethylamine:corrinoid methyltransferase-like protein